MDIQKNKQSITPSAKTNIESHKFEYLLENNSEEKLREELKSISPGIETGYKIGNVDLSFPGGAISIIAAPTSHGKTTALINFALGILENNPTKNVYFFSYEESASSIQISFLNTWISKYKLSKVSSKEALSKNSKHSIESYFREEDKYITENFRHLFPGYKDEFFQNIINTGRLKVFYSEMQATELIEAISFIKKHDENLGAVFIDYMQLLKLTGSPRISRQEELKQICLMLKDCAVQTGLPIVLAAQFNRTVVTEGDLSSVNIGEAGDIERIASLIVGMYNRNFEMCRDGNKDRNNNRIEKESTIYFEVLKGRKIGSNLQSVMDFDGNRGEIKITLKSLAKDSQNMKSKVEKNSEKDVFEKYMP